MYFLPLQVLIAGSGYKPEPAKLMLLSHLHVNALNKKAAPFGAASEVIVRLGPSGLPYPVLLGCEARKAALVTFSSIPESMHFVGHLLMDSSV